MTGKGGMMMMVPVSVTRDIRQIADDILAGYDPKKGAGLIKEIGIYLDAIKNMNILGWSSQVDNGWRDTVGYNEWQRWRKEQEVVE